MNRNKAGQVINKKQIQFAYAINQVLFIYLFIYSPVN